MPEYHPVYRLDRDTTGLVVMGKDSFAASRLAGRVEKEYRALCEGELLGEGTFDGPIGLLPGHTIQRCVRPDGERAVTHWRRYVRRSDGSAVPSGAALCARRFCPPGDRGVSFVYFLVSAGYGSAFGLI